jgi:N-hydroxyarylamine O-acetyltransferase
MDIQAYLNRIKFINKPHIDFDTLKELHKNHVFEIPFENLDIHYKLLFDLQIENIYQKVIADHRGGFCYELNYIFNVLLNELGFRSRIISSRIFTENGDRGPDYDHMSIAIDIDDRTYLGDVGFGDLFLQPLEIKEGIQNDGRNFFKIEKFGPQKFKLSMSFDGIDFEQKYTFTLTTVPIESFYEICRDKQTNPASYFVKNTICTKPTVSGRITLFNSKLIEKRNGERIDVSISSDDELRKALKASFGIDVFRRGRTD